MAGVGAGAQGERRMAPDTAILRNYVTAADATQFSNLADGNVCINVSHENLVQKMLEMRFDLHTTIGDVKERLRKHTGTAVESMKLMLRSSEGQTICELADPSRMLGFYSVTNGMNLHIIDTDPHSLSAGGWLEDTSLVKKYVMTDEEYDKRNNTLRAYKRDKMKEDPHFRFFPKPKTADTPAYDSPECLDGYSVGQRCQVNPGGRRGVVKHLGQVHGLAGYWVGVCLDEPLGRGDGSVKGKKYFETPGPKFAVFSRPNNVEVGDFPPMDEDDSDFEDTDDEADATAAAGAGATAAAAATTAAEETPATQAAEAAVKASAESGSAGAATAAAVEDDDSEDEL